MTNLTTATWYIRINNPNGSLRSELRVKVEAGVNDDKLSKTICTDLAAAGAALAGLFTGGAAAAAGTSPLCSLGMFGTLTSSLHRHDFGWLGLRRPLSALLLHLVEPPESTDA